MKKRFLLLLVAGLFVPSVAQAATLYWVGADAASTAVASSWATADPVACEPGNGQVPGLADVLIFDADCDTDATVTADLTVTAFTMQSGYAGTIQQVPETTVTVGSFEQNGGIYNANGGTLIIGGVAVAAVPTSSPPPISPLSTLLTALLENTVDAGLVALATAAAISVLASLPGLWSTVFLDLLRGFLPLIGPLRRRRRPVGRVVNEADGRPLAGATVHIFDVLTNRLRETIVTGADGSFGTILPPGTYLFSAQKAGYTSVFTGSAAMLFPGEKLATDQSLVVQEEGTVVPLVFFMRRVAPYAWRERWRARFTRWWQTSQIVLARISLPLLLAGAALNVVALLRQPTWLLYGLSILYLLFLLLELFVSRRFRRAFGRVVDVAFRQPVFLAAIRLIDPTTKRIVQTRVTTTGGQYLMLAPHGDYRLQFAHPQYQLLEQAVAIRPAAGSAVVFDATLVRREAA